MTNTTILKMPYDDYKKNTIIRIVICIVIVIAVLAVNVVLYHSVTEETATLFTVINVVLDTACCWVVLYYTVNVLLVRKRLLKIYKSAVDNPASIEGKIASLSSPQKVYKFDCLTAALETNEGVRKVFVIIGSFEELLTVGAKVRLQLSDNVAISAEVENEK